MIQLTINGKPAHFDGDPDMPLLWYLRDELALTGTKFGCGLGLCGACTVHVNGAATASAIGSSSRPARHGSRPAWCGSRTPGSPASADWMLAGYYHAARSGPAGAGDAARKEEPVVPAPNYWLPVGAWYDPAAATFLGVTADHGAT